jgi:hypothetical protein
VLRRLSVTVGSLLGFLVVMGALLGALVVPVLDSPPTRTPTTGPSEPGSAGDGDGSAAEAPAPTPDQPATTPPRRPTELATGRTPSERTERATAPRPTTAASPGRSGSSTNPRSPRSPRSPAPVPRAPARPAVAPPSPPPAPLARPTPAPPAPTPPTTATPPTPPTPPPTSPPSPARQLQFLPGGEPLLCDATERTAGTLRGAGAGETIHLTAPDLPEPIVLSADRDGVATVTWRCDPDAARTVELTAWRADGRQGVTFPVTGVSEPGAPSLAELNAQARVDAAADGVLDAVEAADVTAGDEGFAGIVVSPQHNYVDLYWKGTPPPAVADAIERATAATGVPVTTWPADHTRRHLLQRARMLVTGDRLPDDAAAFAEGIHRVAVVPDGDGLEVGITVPAELDDSGVTRWSREVRGALEGALGVPVHVVVDAPPRPFGRLDDAPPWRGGAAIVGEGRCSTGFGVRRAGGGSRPALGLLTAAHCRGDAGGHFRTGDGTQVVGPARGSAGGRLDSRVIPVEQVDARIYSGGVGGTSEFTRPVRRSGRNLTGDEVCTSGAATGARCDLVIVNVDTFYRPAGATAYARVVEALSRRPDADVAAGQGDSGGPVFTVAADGGAEARGTIAGGSRAVACGRAHLGACTANVFFVDIGAALDRHRAALVTTESRP